MCALQDSSLARWCSLSLAGGCRAPRRIMAAPPPLSFRCYRVVPGAAAPPVSTGSSQRIRGLHRKGGRITMFAHLARARVGAERGRRRCGRIRFANGGGAATGSTSTTWRMPRATTSTLFPSSEIARICAFSGGGTQMLHGAPTHIEPVVGPDRQKLPAMRLVVGKIVVDDDRLRRIVEIALNLFQFIDLCTLGDIGSRQWRRPCRERDC